MNIAKILKDFPKGTKLYSSLFGELELIDVKNSSPYPTNNKKHNEEASND